MKLSTTHFWEWQTARILTLLIFALCIVAAYRAGYMKGRNEGYQAAFTLAKGQFKDYTEIIKDYDETIEGYKRLVNEYARIVNELKQRLTMCQNELARVTTEYQNTLAKLQGQY